MSSSSEVSVVPDPPQAVFKRTLREWQGLERFGEVSVGSIGHPYTCNLPCKYFKRQRGCKDGANCTRCHVCPWRHSAVSKAKAMKQLVNEADVQSESARSTTAPPSVLDEQEHLTSSVEMDQMIAGLCPPVPNSGESEQQTQQDDGETPSVQLDGGSEAKVDAALIEDTPSEKDHDRQSEDGTLDFSKIDGVEPARIAFAGTPEWSIGSLNHPHACRGACKYRRRKGGCRDGRKCQCCHFCQWSRQSAPKETTEQSEATWSVPYVAGLEFVGAFLHTAGMESP
mmetsp:Transcript_46736/g.111149  ORF Transcript_46736/g.111149 Transcript_46736/m.111149 type:complete len:283 (-) Transcript_46736:163-1011(-)